VLENTPRMPGAADIAAILTAAQTLGILTCQVSAPGAARRRKRRDLPPRRRADAWAVGYAATKNCAYNCIDQTVAVHWNGTRWTRVATPDPGGPNQSSILFGMGAAGPSDVWAVGQYYLSAAEVPHTLILHWDGTSWSQF